MDSRERQVVQVAATAAKVGLDFILVGNSGAWLHGSPLVTEDVDVFVRDTPRNRRKIREFARSLGTVVTEPFAPLSNMLRVQQDELIVDFIFRFGHDWKFESVRSRSELRQVAGYKVKLAALPDIIAAKKAAGRPKDVAALPMLETVLRTKTELEKELHERD
jgi:predicted nucleotidyltransferase